MRVAIFPAHAESAASSRIRAYTLLRSLAGIGCETALADIDGADVVLVQKRVSPELLDIIARARDNGALIVYDVDDIGRALWYHIAPTALFRLLGLVDVVITDTEMHAESLRRDYGIAAVEIVPDAVDYHPVAPARPPLSDGKSLRVLWFGSASNIALFERDLPALQSIEGVQVVGLTNAHKLKALSARHPRVSFLPWARETFVEVLQSCDLTVLSHDGSAADLAKSNNRMIASITWGVPALVSRTPEYERTAREAHIEYAVFGDETEMAGAIEHLRSPAARKAYLDSAQPEIWDRYSPHAVARRFLDVVNSSQRRTGGVRPARFLPWLRRASRGNAAWPAVYEAIHLARRLRGKVPS